MSGPACSALAFGGAAVRRAAQGNADRDQRHPEREEADVPGERGAEVVAYVVDAEQLMVDEALDEVERTPSGEQHAEVRAPRWRQLASLPRANDQQGRCRDEQPRGEVKDPSTSVLASNPATVVIGSPPPSPVSM
jgi:hypothetical protein